MGGGGDTLGFPAGRPAVGFNCLLFCPPTLSPTTSLHCMQHEHPFPPPNQSACLDPLTPCRWRGDYGGKKQLWFPANYVEEIVSTQAQEQDEAVSAMSPRTRDRGHLRCLQPRSSPDPYPEAGGCSWSHSSLDPFLEAGGCSQHHASPDPHPEAGGCSTTEQSMPRGWLIFLCFCSDLADSESWREAAKWSGHQARPRMPPPPPPLPSSLAVIGKQPPGELLEGLHRCAILPCR